jgi:hypothetical protein
MSQLSLEDICLSFCRDTALEILALRQQGGGFLPCLTTKILRIYSSRFNWYINSLTEPLDSGAVFCYDENRKSFFQYAVTRSSFFLSFKAKMQNRR